MASNAMRLTKVAMHEWYELGPRDSTFVPFLDCGILSLQVQQEKIIRAY